MILVNLLLLQETTGHPADGSEPEIPALFKEEHATGPLLAASPATLPLQQHGGPPGPVLNQFAPHSRCFVSLRDTLVSHTAQLPLYPAQPPHPVNTEGPYMQQDPFYALPQDHLALPASGNLCELTVFNGHPVSPGVTSLLAFCVPPRCCKSGSAIIAWACTGAQ